MQPEVTAILATLQLLREAAYLANDAGCDPWDFAVEMRAVLRAGASRSQCRWLIAKGFVVHRHEIIGGQGPDRQFGPESRLKLQASSCFVITEVGMHALQSDFNSAASTRSEPPVKPLNGYSGPSWNSVRKELLFRNVLVKRFRLPAPNQELILSAFEEEHWCLQIDDPLPHQPALPPKQRLHDAIKALNQNQINRLLRFSGNGRGTGICWQPLE